jgi:hypothetical protein
MGDPGRPDRDHIGARDQRRVEELATPLASSGPASRNWGGIHTIPERLGKELLLKSRTDLQGAIERFDDAMRNAANDARDSSEHWRAWGCALAALPPKEEVSGDLGYWWQNQLLDAGRRAFEHKGLRRRYHQGRFDAGGLPMDGVVWNSVPCIYRDREIRVELRREAQGMPWAAQVTISKRDEIKVMSRMFFEGIASAVTGADGAYAQVIEEAKQEIDRQDDPSR